MHQFLTLYFGFEAEECTLASCGAFGADALLPDSIDPFCTEIQQKPGIQR